VEILALKAYASGYRGCVVDGQRYLFFQHSREGRLKELKSYPVGDFSDTEHFIAMMHKFMSPGAFLRPPITIRSLTLEELDRVIGLIKKTRRV
jgi:hypothetical protein